MEEEIKEMDLWHYALWETFSEMVYTDTLNDACVMGNGAEQHQDSIFEINAGGITAEYDFETPEDHYFYKMQKDKHRYLLPKRYYDKLPLVPKSFVNVKLKKYESSVWRLVMADYESFQIPETKTMEPSEFIKKFNPIVHDNIDTSILFKCVALSKGLKIALCGDYGGGKNSNYNIKSAIQRNAISGMKNKTEAMFYKLCLFNDDINIDEITTWNPQKIQAIEDKLATYGDQSTKDQKHALDSNKANEVIKNVTHKSFVLTFNPYDEKKHPRYFGENMGNPGKIEDRYPFLYATGKVVKAPSKPMNGTEEAIVTKNMDYYKEYASNFMYIRNNIHKLQHGYDRSKLSFDDVRKKDNIMPLIDVYDAISQTQEQFDYYINFINECRQRYWDMRHGRNIQTLQGTEEMI